MLFMDEYEKISWWQTTDKDQEKRRQIVLCAQSQEFQCFTIFASFVIFKVFF